MKTDVANDHETVEGLVHIDGQPCYLVPDVHLMPPFLVAVVSPSDHWMYASSAGGVAAGRVDAEGSLFPYRTDDLLHQVGRFSGGFTALRVDGETWEPFTGRPHPGMRRHLARSVAGDRLILEEHHERLGLSVRAAWAFSDPSGILRTTTITRVDDRDADRSIEVMDGLRELVAGGAGVGVMQSMSCLVDAYTRTELVGDRGLAVITMESALSDRAEPAESLIATTAWGTNLDHAEIHLDPHAAEAFLQGRPVVPESRVTGRPGAWLRRTTVVLSPGQAVSWSTAADVRRRQSEVVALRRRIESGGDLPGALAEEIEATSRAMDRLSAETDGLEHTGDPVVDAHHRTNTLYNDMRGGIPFDRDRFPWGDWCAFCRDRNRSTAARHAAWLDARAPEEIVPIAVLDAEVAELDDPGIERLSLEYLPFWFGRRHGDPSRPWNRFQIRIRDEDGGRILAYEGNWRDIFQNWEALGLAHPEWIDRFIAKFLNATTADGFNAYRLTRDGIDWEVPEPDNPWSNLGYWGDHQIVYLTRLLEASLAARPATLPAWGDRAIFSYADVPYRLADHARLVEDPRRSIDFDRDAHEASSDRAASTGSDGRLVHDELGVIHAGLGEKLLIPVLAKLGAFVPDGGIWMNTQRPEWNDANNALAGWGLSMVTACQLRRHLDVLRRLHAGRSASMRWSGTTVRWLEATLQVLESEHGLLMTTTIDDTDRRRVLDRLSLAFEARRRDSIGRPDTDLAPDRVVRLCEVAIEWLDHAIAANRREDGLHHGYNLLVLGDGTAEIRRLPEMLEGQVAVLSSHAIDGTAAADLLDALFESSLHRDDLDTFLLQPARSIPPLLDKGVLTEKALGGLDVLRSLAADGDRTIVERDAEGTIRFAAAFHNARDLEAAIDAFPPTDPRAATLRDARARILEAYETIFDHHAFTGRSGGMYGYEGIGCTYWHMVAKLLVAIGEVVQRAMEHEEDPSVVQRLVDHYHHVRDGLGFRMDAKTFGALPIDAYSHSNGDGQARQPGMTGQVKEELITRRMELGVSISEGRIRLAPRLLPESEWTSRPTTWRVPAIADRPETEIDLPVGSVGFLGWGVPIVYLRTDGDGFIDLLAADGTTTTVEGDRLDEVVSSRILSWHDAPTRITVHVPTTRT